MIRIRGLLILSVVGVSVIGVSGAAHAAPTTYRISKETAGQIRFSVKAPLDVITGVSDAVSGKIDFDPTTGKGTGWVSVDLRSFRTGISLRDDDLRQRFFESRKYEKATLRVHRITGKGNRRRILGTMLLHGVSKKVSIPVKVNEGTYKQRPYLEVRSTFVVTFSDYNIPRPSVLFLKLGEKARVNVHAVFVGPEPKDAPRVAETKVDDNDKLPTATLFKKGAFIPVAQIKKVKSQRFRFKANTLTGKGERLMADHKIGGPQNAMTCHSCHSVADERFGILRRGIVKPNNTLYNSVKRGSLWQGLAKKPGDAASICVKLFMLNQNGLSKEQASAIGAYLKAISPDEAVPALDYRVVALTRSAPLKDPARGSRTRGARLTKQFCNDCHSPAAMRPPLTVGLYEPEYLVRRVRWLSGHDARQMPPIYVDRLPDRDLRDIVTYLAGDTSKRIFDRRNQAQWMGQKGN